MPGLPGGVNCPVSTTWRPRPGRPLPLAPGGRAGGGAPASGSGGARRV